MKLKSGLAAFATGAFPKILFVPVALICVPLLLPPNGPKGDACLAGATGAEGCILNMLPWNPADWPPIPKADLVD